MNKFIFVIVFAMTIGQCFGQDSNSGENECASYSREELDSLIAQDLESVEVASEAFQIRVNLVIAAGGLARFSPQDVQAASINVETHSNEIAAYNRHLPFYRMCAQNSPQSARTLMLRLIHDENKPLKEYNTCRFDYREQRVQEIGALRTEIADLRQRKRQLRRELSAISGQEGSLNELLRRARTLEREIIHIITFISVNEAQLNDLSALRTSECRLPSRRQYEARLATQNALEQLQGDEAREQNEREAGQNDNDRNIDDAASSTEENESSLTAAAIES